MLELEDKLLVLRFNRGDRGVLHRIYDRYKDDLVTLAAAMLPDVGSAEDVVHDVFLSFLSSAGRFRLTGSLRGYLATCVVNRARNVNKAGRRRQGPALDDVPDVPGGDPPPEQAAILGEQLGRLADALRQLPYEQREALLLRSYGRMRFAAIARAQGVSVNTAQGRFRYAVARLRSILDYEVDE